MTKEEPLKEILELTSKLLRYQYEYYVLSKPSISDLEYDRLFDRLLRLEKEYPQYIQPYSPTQRVGSDLSEELPEVKHTINVLSLDKAYNIHELRNWIEKNRTNTGEDLSYVLEEKIDGASVVLYYGNGILRRALTRGNGYTGNDITGNIKTIGSVPLKLTEEVTVAVRGEVFLPKKYFNAINSGMETAYANPRNLASGTLRRVKSSRVAEVPLDFFAHEGYFETSYSSHVEILNELYDLNFKLNPNLYFFSDKVREAAPLNPSVIMEERPLSDLEEVINRLTTQREYLDYEIDGLVLKVNEISAREKLGFTGHHPRWAMAYKFDSPEGITEILQIDVQVGRTGRITPVARVKPVKIAGSTVSNVTLHNQEYIDMLELSLGDIAAVSKRGDIIPAVERIIDKNEQGNPVWKMPKDCPSCGEGLILRGAHHFCNNRNCPDQIKGRIRFFASRNNMDIENLGPETLNLLIEKGFVKDLCDIYTFNPDDLTGLPGMGEKKIKLIKEGIEKSKKQPFSIVLQSLGIPELGQKAIELLINAGYRDIDSLFDLADKNDLASLLKIHGFGEKTANSIINELKKPDLRRRIELLRAQGLSFSLTAEENGEKNQLPLLFSNQVWCITGTFKNFNPREKAAIEIKKRGGRVVNAISSKTTHLLCGENPGSKLQKAANIGVIIVKEKEFTEMLKQLP